MGHFHFNIFTSMIAMLPIFNCLTIRIFNLKFWQMGLQCLNPMEPYCSYMFQTLFHISLKNLETWLSPVPANFQSNMVSNLIHLNFKDV